MTRNNQTELQPESFHIKFVNKIPSKLKRISDTSLFKTVSELLHQLIFQYFKKYK